MADILVRAAESDDVPAWTAIQNRPAVYREMLQVPWTAVAERQGTLASTPADRFLVAEIDGEVVGTIAVHIFAGRRKHVGSFGMGVHDAFQRRGVGSALVQVVLDLADNWYNLRRMEIEVFADNKPAIALYRKFGFEVEGRHRAVGFRDGAFADTLSMARLRESPRITTNREGPA